MCGKKFQSFSFFFVLSLSLSPSSSLSFFYCYYYYYCRFSCVACSHLFSSLSSLTKSQGGEAVCDFDYRLFFFFFFLFFLVCFFSIKKKNDVRKNKVVTTLIQSAFCKRQQVDGISLENTTVKPTKKQKLCYPKERTSA